MQILLFFKSSESGSLFCKTITNAKSKNAHCQPAEIKDHSKIEQSEREYELKLESIAVKLTSSLIEPAESALNSIAINSFVR